MERRDVLLGMGAVALAAVARGAAAADEHAAHHHHGGAYGKLAGAASECRMAAQVCVDHCLELLGQGDKSLAACARSAYEVAAVCAALQQLATQSSPHLKAFAKVAQGICSDCEQECKKHDEHEQCRKCGEACAACAKECEAVGSA